VCGVQADADLPHTASASHRICLTLPMSSTVRYTSMNLTDGWASCFAWGSESALVAKRAHCAAQYGPYPFVSGPFELLSPDLLRWLSPRLPSWHSEAGHAPALRPAAQPSQPSLSVADPTPQVPASGQMCQFEDRLLGLTLASHPRLHLVNLAHSLGHMNVVNNRGEWLGPDSFAAHWVKRYDLFARLLEELSSIESTVSAVRRTGRRFCATTAARLARGGSAATAARSAGAFCNATRLQLRCRIWRSEFSQLAEFPCCRDWVSCSGPPRGAFVHWPKNRSKQLGWSEWHASRRSKQHPREALRRMLEHGGTFDRGAQSDRGAATESADRMGSR
jgi:hypothetical protein